MMFFSFDGFSYSRNHRITKLEGIFRDLEYSKQKTFGHPRLSDIAEVSTGDSKRFKEFSRNTLFWTLTTNGMTRTSVL